MKCHVLIFGTFDGFDKGHQLMVSEAAKKGSELIVAVARDEHVRILKQKVPRYGELQRLNRVLQDPHVFNAVLSDKELGTYQILEKIRPDLIVLGFDQDALKADLIRWMKERETPIPIETLDYFPE